MEEEPKLNEEKMVVIRVDQDLREKLSIIAKKGSTLTALTNEAIRSFIEENEFSFEDVQKLIENIPSLKFQSSLIEKQFKNCPSQSCKNIIETISNKDSFLFEENTTSFISRLSEFDKNKIYGIYAHFILNSLDNMNSVSETVRKTADFFKEQKKEIKLSFDAHIDPKATEKILLFISYKKELNSEENDS